eukprot:Plantae.Rhodophyta-Palmaria_palmata.ctg6582.p1 GENE.Plantae.Rhodophyta-Palmaria_palmata.ctg6582~~Plantae.Rhodophyta-Palmaria_palmata.ctg6582.p1  ORF type:complete len:197 (+),score=27.77 Plantae.Rhodophyta-Palmaria_palmata.ctg6582:386-976(+)
MWRKLESRFVSTSEKSHLTVPYNLAKKERQPGGNVVTFMSELDSAYERLEVMDELMTDRMKTVKLLNSLPDEYNSLSAALSTQANRNRTWKDVKDLFQDEYERIENSKGKKSTKGKLVALYTKEQRQNVLCSKCKKKGHIERNCRSKANSNDETDDSEKAGSTSRDREGEEGAGSKSKARKASSKSSSRRVKLLMA